MTAPRHLWSGDWQGDSAAAAEELAARRAQSDQPGSRAQTDHPKVRPARTPPPRSRAQSPPAPRRRRARRPARQTRLRGTLLLVLAMLVSAGVAFAGVLLLFGSSAQSSVVSSRPPAWLGVDTAGSLPAGLLSPNGGVLVDGVVPGSPAAAAGLEPGDVITQIGSRPVAAPSDVESAIAGMHAGEQAEIQYQRGLEAYRTVATLTARPANP